MAEKDKNITRVLRRTYVHGALRAKYVGFLKPRLSTSHLDSYYRLELTEATVIVDSVIGWEEPLPNDFGRLEEFTHTLPADTAFIWKDEDPGKFSLSEIDTVYSLRLHSPMVAGVHLHDTMVEDSVVFGTLTCAIRGYILHEEELKLDDTSSSDVATTAEPYNENDVAKQGEDAKEKAVEKEPDGCMPFPGCYWLLLALLILFILGIFGVFFYYFPKQALVVFGVIIFLALISWLYGLLLRLAGSIFVGCLPAGCLPAGCLPVGCLPVSFASGGCFSLAGLLPILFVLYILGVWLYRDPIETLTVLGMAIIGSMIYWLWERTRMFWTALFYFVIGIIFLSHLVIAMFTVAHEGTVVPKMVKTDLPEERSSIMPFPIRPDAVPVTPDMPVMPDDTLATDSLLTENTQDSDTVITHTRLWNGYNGESYGGQFQILQSDINRAKVLRTAVVDQFEHATMMELLMVNDTDRLNGLYAVFDSLRIAHTLDTLRFAEMVVSCIQDIPYTLLLPGPCDVEGGGRLSADMQQYLAEGGRCLPNIVGGIFTPVEFMGSLEGDCDTRSLLLYTVLDHYGYDVALLVSYTLQHAVLGINLPYPGAAYELPGKRYVLWETTSEGFRPGDVPTSMQNMRHWEPLLLSRKELL